MSRKHGFFRPHLGHGFPQVASTTLREGGGWIYPGSALDLDFANQRSYNSLTGYSTPSSILTYTSPSPKLVYDASGTLAYAPHNLFLNSGDVSNATWTKSGVTVLGDVITADAGGAHHRISRNTSTSGVQKVFFDVKPGTHSKVQILDGGSVDNYANFDLQSGTVGTAGSNTSATIADIGDGYYRCSVTYGSANTPNGNSFLILVPSTSSAWGPTWAAVGTETVSVIRAQLQKMPAPTADVYVPTTSAAVYRLPYDYNPTTHEALGVLIEEQRTNLLTYSEQFDNAAWTKSRATVTANAVTAPDGTTTADKLVPSVDVGVTHRIYQSGITHGVLRTYTYTCYLKAAEYTFAKLAITDASESDNANCRFNLSSGALDGLASASGTFSAASASIVDVGGGWYRCTLIATCDATEATVSCFIFSGNTTAGANSFTGDGTSGIYIWGAQLEAGAFATSYIPTVASQVTRAADQVSILTSAFSFSDTVGTVYIKADAQFGPADTVRYMAAFLADGNNFIRPYTYSTPQRGGFTIRTAGVNVADCGAADGLLSGVSFKQASAWEVNNVANTVNGINLQTDSSVTLPTGLTTLLIGSNSGVNVLCGHISRLTYWNTRKSNSELQALSA